LSLRDAAGAGDVEATGSIPEIEALFDLFDYVKLRP
jgi:hypothetical protein